MNIMRKIDSIIIHCLATKVGQDFTAADIDRWHRERGFNGISLCCLSGRKIGERAGYFFGGGSLQRLE